LAKLSFILQGLDEEISHYNEILKLLETSDPNRFILSTAFLRSKAVLLLADKLLINKERIDFYVGIGNNVTSFQALKALLDIGINPYVVDTGCSDLIFHPKVYLVHCSTDNYAKTITGSSNFTPRGLVGNIESSTIVELNLTLPEDSTYLNSIFESFDRLRNDHTDNVFKISSVEELTDLLDKNRLLDESRATTIKHHEDSTNDGETENGDDESTPKIPRIKLKTPKVRFPTGTPTGIPGTPTGTLGTPTGTPGTPAGTPTGTSGTQTGTSGTPTGTPGTLVWRKSNLRQTDAQYLPPGSNSKRTGNLRLSQADFKIGGLTIDHTTYFRNQLFGSLTWSVTSSLQIASATFTIEIAGVVYGPYNLEISHSPSRVAGQGNVSTVLHWGDAAHTLRTVDLRGYTLELYKVSSTEFYIKFII